MDLHIVAIAEDNISGATEVMPLCDTITMRLHAFRNSSQACHKGTQANLGNFHHTQIWAKHLKMRLIYGILT